MATEEQVQELERILGEITGIDVPGLFNAEARVSNSSFQVRLDLERLIELCNYLKALPISKLPKETAHDIAYSAENIIPAIMSIPERIDGFQTRREETVLGFSDLESKIDYIFQLACPYVSYLAFIAGAYRKHLEEMESMLSETSERLESTEAHANSQREEFDSLIQKAREASVSQKTDFDDLVQEAKSVLAKTAVSEFTALFGLEAKAMDGRAKCWLAATAVLVIISALFAIYFLRFAEPNLESTAGAVDYVSTKILILGLLITATLWCGNVYKAAKHQATVNKFKSNSLRTFQAFVKAADNADVKDAVLMEATRAIFHESSTGYFANDRSGGEKITKISEVLKRNSPDADGD